MQNDQRQLYSLIKKKYEEIGKGTVRLSTSDLFLIIPIDANKTSYEFPVLDNEQINNNREIRLNINDEFIASKMGLYLGTNIGNVDRTNDSFNIFTSAPVEHQANVTTLDQLYNGAMRIDVNNVNYVEKWATIKHRYKGITQMLSNLGNDFASLPSQDNDETAMCDLDGLITFSGAKKNRILLDLEAPITPRNVTFVTQAGNNVELEFKWIALRFKGFLAQNASKFQQ